MENCLFCKIINKEIPSYKIYEDEFTYAFLDISKDMDTHTLVVPKKHVTNILDCDLETLNHVMNTVQKISKHYIDVGYKGINIFNNNNIEASQSIMHFHVHIVARLENDGIDPNFKVTPGAKIEFEKIAKKLAL